MSRTGRSLVAIIAALPLLGGTPLPDGPEWRVLQREQVWVACEPGTGTRWCTASALLGVSMADLTKLVAAVERYPEHFKTVRSAAHLDERTIAIEIDLPGPLPRKRVVVAWERHDHDQVVEFRFHPPDAGVDVRTEGLFRLTPAEGGTLLEYRWRPLAGLPSLLSRPLARIHGHNVVWGLALALDSAPTVPLPPG